MDEKIGRFNAEVERPEPIKFAWPIVALPDLFCTARHLGVMLGYLASIGWEVFAPDLRGAAADRKHASFNELAALVEEVLDAIARDVVVVGHGVGGLIALRLAANPRVRAAVAIAPLIPGVATNLRGGFFSRMRARRSGAIEPPSGRAAFDFLADADAFARDVLIKSMVPESDALLAQIERGDISLVSPPDFSDAVETLSPQSDPASAAAESQPAQTVDDWLAESTGDERAAPETRSPQGSLTTLSGPPDHSVAAGDIRGHENSSAARLVVAGEADPLAQVAKSLAFAESVGAKSVTIPGRGHWLVSGRALERVIGELQRFLVKSLGQDLLLLYPEEWKEK